MLACVPSSLLQEQMGLVPRDHHASGFREHAAPRRPVTSVICFGKAKILKIQKGPSWGLRFCLCILEGFWSNVHSISIKAMNKSKQTKTFKKLYKNNKKGNTNIIIQKQKTKIKKKQKIKKRKTKNQKSKKIRSMSGSGIDVVFWFF